MRRELGSCESPLPGRRTGSSSGGADEVIEIADRGFADEDIFTGVLGANEVLLVLDGGEFFLLAGDLAARGTYAVQSVDFSASGQAFRITADSQPIDQLTMTGTYRTDRHLDLTWTEVTNGRASNLIVEASNAYFQPAALDNVIGAWINQDEGNLLFLSVSQNLGSVAGDDYVVAEPAQTIDIHVLANDRDPDGDPLRIESVDETTRRGAVVTIQDNGTPLDFSDDFLRYTVPDGFAVGVDRVSYVIEDPEEGSDRADVVITVPAASGDLTVTAEPSLATPAAGAEVTLIANQEVGSEEGDGDVDIDAGVLNFLAFNADNIAVEFEDGHEIRGSSENPYFITSKRDYEPHLAEAVQPHEIPDLAVEPIVIGYDLAELIEEARRRILLGDYEYRMPEAGSDLQTASRDLLLRMHPIADDTFAERFNEALAEAIHLLALEAQS